MTRRDRDDSGAGAAGEQCLDAFDGGLQRQDGADTRAAAELLRGSGNRSAADDQHLCALLVDGLPHAGLHALDEVLRVLRRGAGVALGHQQGTQVAFAAIAAQLGQRGFCLLYTSDAADE